MRASIFFASLSRRAAVLMLLLIVTTATYAQITPSDDAYVNSATPTTNNGTLATLNLSSAANTSFIRFDLTAVPASYTGASIAKATLKLYVNTVPKAGSFNVDLVNGTWSEKTIDYTNQPALGTTIAGSVPLTTASKGTYVEIDITSAVIEWLNNTQPNDGIALVANSPLIATFDSKENTATSHPPELDIVYASGTITGVTTASGSGLTGGGTNGTLNLGLTNACAANQVLQWNGTAWVCANLGGVGTITGVTAGTDLIGGGTNGNVTLNLDITQVPQLNYANFFTGNQTVNGNLSATGLVTGAAFNIGSNLFAFGSYANANAFLGFAGNATTTGYGNTVSGYQSLAANTTGTFNTASGYQALLSNTTGSLNTASGIQALYFNTTGSQNTATGVQALYSNTTGGSNAAFGTSALSSNTTGFGNTAEGSQALMLNTTGINNTASGNSALNSNTTGQENTASGMAALYSNTTGGENTASGDAALFSNTTGLDNTASGVATLENNTTGGDNTAVGANALASNTTGSYLTCLGALCHSSVDGLVNATAIGATASVSQSNSLVLGGTGSYAVNVGIGTTAPQYTLDVHGTGNFTGLVNFASGQKFPGSGTIMGVTAGTDLTGGGSSGNVTLNVDTTKVVTGVTAGTDLTGGGTGGVPTLNLDTTKVPQLAAANTFTGAQTINNNVAITASGNALTVNGGNLGVYGSGFTYGVFGSSMNMYGVYGTSTYGYGVYGYGPNSGVYGIGPVFGVYGSTDYESGSNGVYGDASNAPNSWGVFSYGNFGATGSKSAVVALPDDRVVALYTVESPENWFEDFGSGELKNGVATIKLDTTFAQTVSPEAGYHVFLTPKGDCDGLYVGQETATGFQVRELHRGKSNVAFDYRIVAKRKGLESIRLEEVSVDHETAVSIRQQIASRSSHPPLLKMPKHQQQAAVPEPPK